MAGLRWRALVFLLLLALAATHGAVQLMEMHARRDEPLPGPPATTLDVLSYNVLTGNLRAEEAARYIVETSPDVAVIMETPGIDDYLDEIAAVLPYRVGCMGPGGRIEVAGDDQVTLQPPQYANELFGLRPRGIVEIGF